MKDRLQLQLGIREELLKKIKQIQDLLSQKKSKPVSIEQALEEMTVEYLRRHDPIERAKRADERNRQAVSRRSRSQGTVGLNSNKASTRTPIPTHVKHQLILRDQGQCSFVDKQGNRCEEKRWLEMDHIVPIYHGGSNQLENLRLFCYAHHKLRHALDGTPRLVSGGKQT